jgi:hypothetical protein
MLTLNNNGNSKIKGIYYLKNRNSNHFNSSHNNRNTIDSSNINKNKNIIKKSKTIEIIKIDGL